ncbi:cupin [Cupriavidus sp. TA19]|uniref:cupin domain-containing protein n=1 Tax=unclassified Cupriavidus TaxID=2640874 RepID=UPI000E2F54DA|nr:MULTISPECIES: cupin domain-containing protein [unclassified Cupriavidus]BDB28975.1 cupin domain-containing protein [Cupriavidus sp. P-10]GLC92905.1 cupin [Cupriavidus sp. TA19]
MHYKNLVILSAVALMTGSALAQKSGLTRTVVGRADVSVPGREAVVARVEVAPGAYAGRHTHPGDEISYVMDGEVQLLVDGQSPRTIKAGESFVVPAGVVHDAHNSGSTATRLVGVYVVEKGKPLASPAP